LVVVGELTHQEAAGVLDVPLGTVLSRVSRARARLREYLLAQRRKESLERTEPAADRPDGGPRLHSVSPPSRGAQA
jgi:RNA polymerase sigma-70 factor (ECF subfamily)